MTAQNKAPTELTRRLVMETDRRLVWLVAGASWAGLVGLVIAAVVLLT